MYTLSKQGATEAGTPFVYPKWRPDSFLLGNAFVAHQLALGDLYICASAKEISWQQPALPLSPVARVIPDVYIDDGQQAFLLEMDLGTEALSVWTRKVSAYLKFAVSGEYRGTIPHSQFAVLVVADSDSRLTALRRHISKQTQKLFWFSTLDTIKRQGFWAASWLRATGDARSLPGA